MKIIGKWTKFKDLPKKDKIFRIVNMIIALALFSVTLALFIYYLLTGDKNNRFFVCVLMMVLFLVPFLIEIIFRRRIKNLITFCFLVYCFISGFIGSVLNLYHLLSWYDILVHTLAGYTFSLVGIFLLSRLENYQKLNPLTIIIFCFAVTLAVELIWELLEWGADNLLHQTAQGDPVEGFKVPFVTDTDLDLLCNFTGGVIFAIQFAIGKYTKYSLGTKFIERELSPSKTIVVNEVNNEVNVENSQKGLSENEGEKGSSENAIDNGEKIDKPNDNEKER